MCIGGYLYSGDRSCPHGQEEALIPRRCGPVHTHTESSHSVAMESMDQPDVCELCEPCGGVRVCEWWRGRGCIKHTRDKGLGLRNHLRDIFIRVLVVCACRGQRSEVGWLL